MKELQTESTKKQQAVFSENNELRQAQEIIKTNNEVPGFQNEEKIRYEAELKTANNSLTKIKRYQKKYIKGLEEMMFLTSHAVRKPVANIIGIVTQLEDSRLPKDFRKLIECLRVSALSLETFTRQLTVKINILKKKGNTSAKP